jgi:arginine decarboxylase
MDMKWSLGESLMNVSLQNHLDMEGYLHYLELLQEVAVLDNSVSVPGLGSPFRPEPYTPLGKAQEEIAEIYGVKQAFMLPTGTTALNILAVAAAAPPGSKIALQRNSHVSVYAAIINLGLEPIFLDPTYSPELDVVTSISPDQLLSAFEQHPDIRTVFLTSPNYFGITGDLSVLIEIAHNFGSKVIVDEAHGAYFNFYQHPPMPVAAEHLSADIITQSTHKTIGALSQGSLLLLNDTDLIDPMYEAINVHGYVSTSFSYPILVSISIAVAQMAFHGESLLANVLKISEFARTEINNIPGLHCFGQESVKSIQGIASLDPLRLTVNVREWGMTGYEVEAGLQEQHIYPELATLDNVLFLLTPFDEPADARIIVEGLHHLAPEQLPNTQRMNLPPPSRPAKILNPRDAYYHPKKTTLSLDRAIGKPCRETIAAYPPGSAVIVMGEEITSEVIEYLQQVRSCGGYLKGLLDNTFTSLSVVDI